MGPETVGRDALALLLLFAFSACVFVASFAASSRLRAEERLGLALATGPALFGWASLLPSLALGLNALSVGSGMALAMLPAAWLLGRRPALRGALAGEWRDLVARARSAPRPTAAIAGALALCLALAAPILGRVWIEAPDGSLATGTANNLGDVVLHVGIAHAFVHGENLPPDDPIWSGHRLAYPFVPDFASAALIVAGARTGAALAGPSIQTLLGILILLGCLAWRACGRLEAALLPGPLLLLGGGSQYLLALGSWLGNDGLRWPDAEALAARHIVWQNPLLSLLVTQRTTLAGLGIILAVVLLVWVASSERGARAPWRELLAAGLVCASLPLVFAHGFLALAAVLPLALAGRREAWPGALALGAGAALGALPQVLWLAGPLQGPGFVRWMPGWLAADPSGAPGIWALVRFWLWNLGPTVPLALLALLVARRIGLERPGFWAAAWAAFALPSLWAFAPWAWDNTKLFVVWLVLALVPVSVLLSSLASRGWRGLGAAALLIAALCASGAHDVWRALFRESPYLEYTPAQRRAALRLREATPPRAVVLERPHWAQLARLAGRRSSIGYPGHLWSHGIDYAEREREVAAFYRSLAPGGPVRPGQWRAFLEGLGVDFVVVGPGERADFGSDPTRLALALPELFHVGGISVFGVPPLSEPATGR